MNWAYLDATHPNHDVLTINYIYFGFHNQYYMNKQAAAQFFKYPKYAKHRHYEALRAYYLESLTQRNAAERFGFSYSTFRALVSDFQNGKIDFFLQTKPGPKSRQIPDTVSEKIVALRKQYLSVYDIQEQLKKDGIKTSHQTINRVLKEQGFAKLPRRTNRELGITKKKTLTPPIAKRLDFSNLKNFHN